MPGSGGSAYFLPKSTPGSKRRDDLDYVSNTGLVLKDGRRVALFSVWDPTKGDDPNAVRPEDRVELLHEGEGVYIDSTMGHAYLVAPGYEEAAMLVVCASGYEHLQDELIAEAEARQGEDGADTGAPRWSRPSMRSTTSRATSGARCASTARSMSPVSPPSRSSSTR